MKISIKKWRRMVEHLKLIRLPDRRSRYNVVIGNYIKLLAYPAEYPRAHFLVRKYGPSLVVKFHIDRTKHTRNSHPETDIFSPSLQTIRNAFINS